MKQIARAGGGDAKEKADYEYDSSDGRLTTTTYGNGAYVTYQYWSSGQLSKISHYDASDTLFYSMAYEYDKAGNVTKLTYDDSLENNGDGYIEYEYDDLHRLTREQFFPAQGSSRGAYKLEYWYDAVGNRTKFRRSDKWYTNRIEVYDYSPRNELTRYSYPEGYGRYRYLEYDMRGNRTKSSWSAWPDQWATYEWDSQDRLTKVYNNWNSTSVYYKYDLMGRRVAKKVNDGDWNWYFYDGLQVIAEGKDTDDRTTYTVAPSAIGGIICRDQNGTKYWYHYDRLGNVMGVTDENGDVVRVYDNTAFSYFFTAYEGDGYDNNVSDVQPYHLTTKEWDADIGLYYFNARWYDKNTGRFVSRGPQRMDVEHPYAYVEGNPVNFVDPMGRILGAICNYLAKRAAKELDRTPGLYCECSYPSGTFSNVFEHLWEWYIDGQQYWLTYDPRDEIESMLKHSFTQTCEPLEWDLVHNCHYKDRGDACTCKWRVQPKRYEVRHFASIIDNSPEGESVRLLRTSPTIERKEEGCCLLPGEPIA